MIAKWGSISTLTVQLDNFLIEGRKIISPLPRSILVFNPPFNIEYLEMFIHGGCDLRPLDLPGSCVFLKPDKVQEKDPRRWKKSSRWAKGQSWRGQRSKFRSSWELKRTDERAWPWDKKRFWVAKMRREKNQRKHLWWCKHDNEKMKKNKASSCKLQTKEIIHLKRHKEYSQG